MRITEAPTASGTAVVASDAVHTYPNPRDNRPTPIIHDAAEYLDGYERIRELAWKESYIPPGHDSRVLRLHPLVSDGITVLE